jgi:ubiquinone/menaquinone biosynthesis C-methylase UbiE
MATKDENPDKHSVVFDALHVEYKDMASWYDSFWKTYTSATQQLPLEEVKACIVETTRDDGGTTTTDGDANITVIVDVGCGTGTFMKRLFDEYYVSREEKLNTSSYGSNISAGLPSPTLRLIGIEPSEEMLRQATTKFDKIYKMGDAGRRNDDNYRYVTVILENSPAEQLPLEDNSVDIVVSTNAFHFFRNKQQSLCEIQRVLKSNSGTLILTDWCSDYILVRLYHFMERVRWNWMHGYKDAYPAPLRRDELAELVEAAGLCINQHSTYRVRVFSIFYWGMQSIVAAKCRTRG